MAVTIKQTTFDDFEYLRHIVQDGQSEVVPLGSGRMSGTLSHIKFDDSFGISSGDFSRGVRLRGVTSPTRWTLGMVLSTGGTATAQSEAVLPGTMLVIAPGEERYTSYQSKAAFSVTLVTPATLSEFLSANPAALELPLWKQSVSVVQTPDPALSMRQVAEMSILTNELTAAAKEGLSDQAAGFFKRSILDLFTRNIVKGFPIRELRPRPAARLVCAVDRYLIDAGDRPVHISELCGHFNVHRRKLHRAFMEVYGVPPITFARNKRLGDVHTALLAGDERTAIRMVAREHGFLHLGRFAAEYRELFGEMPSTTLKRAIRMFEMMTWIILSCEAIPGIMCQVSC